MQSELVSPTALRALLPSALLATTGVRYVSVVNPGAPASETIAIFVSDTGAEVEASDTATATGGSATAAIGQPGTPGSLIATATGSGMVSVAKYDGNPGPPTGFNISGGYFDVFVAPGSTLTSLVVENCALDGGTMVVWYDGDSWQSVTPQSRNAATGCVTMNFGTASSPSIAQLTGTFFAVVVPPAPNASTPGAMHGSGIIRHDAGRIGFQFAVRERVSGAERGRIRVDSWTPARGRGRNRQPAGHVRFVSQALSSVVFADDPSSKPGKKPKSGVDTVVFKGTGRVGAQGGYTFEATAVDRGEPGRKRDRFQIVVRDGAGVTVLSVDAVIDAGNIQSTRK